MVVTVGLCLTCVKQRISECFELMERWVSGTDMLKGREVLHVLTENQNNKLFSGHSVPDNV